MVEVPAPLHATYCVHEAADGGDGGKDEKRIGAVAGEAGEEKRDGEAGEDEDVAADEGTTTRVEEAGLHEYVHGQGYARCAEVYNVDTVGCVDRDYFAG